ncbi:DUF433 domain-containing protein [Chthonobacter albigriseus]|uniref:DUF433 domain-containing protein n=1 Tax=Chthonobacter albigriseus TaxID=1683161 RepID=UPI0015EF40DF|nr:DUF433 domain-containing protein [Chthonobacter albigriseus]
MEWRDAIREGVYPVAFVAKLTGSTSTRVSSWLKETSKSKLPPAICTPNISVQGKRVVSFQGLVEARFIAHFRKHGLSLQTIRKAAKKLRANNGPHPFATNSRFRTDGKRVFMEEALDDNERRILDVMTDEFGFPTVLEPSLFESIVYLDDVAARLIPFPEFPNVILDPRFALGRPVVSTGYIPTDTLAAAFLAEGDVDEVAEWYGTDTASVFQAVGFEQRLAA